MPEGAGDGEDCARGACTILVSAGYAILPEEQGSANTRVTPSTDVKPSESVER